MVTRYRADHQWTGVKRTLKEIRKLQTDRRYRDGRGAFFIEGVRNFVQASDNHFDFIVIIYSEKLLTAPLARKLVRQHKRKGVPTIRVRPEDFRSFSQTKRASGISAIMGQRWTSLKSAEPEAGLCWVILGHVRFPGNFGTLIRTSEAVGGAGFILLDRNVDPFAPVTVRASMGALFRQQFIRANFQNLKSWLLENHGHVIGAFPDGNESFHHQTYPQKTLLFLGEERQGLTPEQRSLCDLLVQIPMVGLADSLNLGVAGSLLMYEVFRARNS